VPFAASHPRVAHAPLVEPPLRDHAHLPAPAPLQTDRHGPLAANTPPLVGRPPLRLSPCILSF
jgi:hypothetical protein